MKSQAGKADEEVPDSELTIGLDLGDRSSWRCVWDESGGVLLEQKLGATPKAMVSLEQSTRGAKRATIQIWCAP